MYNYTVSHGENMQENEYTSIPIKHATKKRLEDFKLTAGEYWDDEINRLLDKIEDSKIFVVGEEKPKKEK